MVRTLGNQNPSRTPKDKPKWYSPFTWKYRKYAKFDYYSGPCEVKKEEHCLPFWGKDLPDDASEATWYTVTYQYLSIYMHQLGLYVRYDL